MTRDVDYLLIGGGISCAIAAETLRNEDASGKITILAAENILPYYRPALPKLFLLGRVEQKNISIFDEDFYKKNNIEILLDTKALFVDPQQKRVKTDRAGDIHFKKLLIATGCYPKEIDLPGSHLQGIHFLHHMSDAKAIIEKMSNAKNAVIIGGSFVGIELASSLSEKGIKVTLIAHEFNFFNVQSTNDLTPLLEHEGVEILLQETATKFNGDKLVKSVETDSGKTIPCDFVVMVENHLPATDFLLNSGIKVDNGILVDKYMQTNIADIYAAGDVARFYDPVFGKVRRVEGTDNAVKQGKIAALNMMGDRTSYRTASYCFFSAFDNFFIILGDATEANHKLLRGSIKDKNFALLYLKDNLLKAAFFCGRPISEIKAIEALIVNRINLAPYKSKAADLSFPLEPLASQTLLTLQGGGALGAFECGVVKAMEEQKIYPDIVSGISIGAFNSAIIASNPKNAAQALESFWEELTMDTLEVADEQMRRFLSSCQSIVWGSPKFFHPRWFMPIDTIENSPLNWTSYYDSSFIKTLLCKYIDFSKLKDSPVRLLLMAVNVETSEFETFDSYTDEITPDHILASGSLPPGFPWTTINGKHYWDGGVVTNTPLDSTLEICGSSGKKVYIVELYPRIRALPKNMLEVLTRKDEILLSEKIRKDIRQRMTIGNYRKLVNMILRLCQPDTADEIKQWPIYIQTMGDPGLLSTTRIIRETHKDDPYSWDSDFSRETIEQHKLNGYETAKKALENQKD